MEREGKEGKESGKLCCLDVRKVSGKWVYMSGKIVEDMIDVIEMYFFFIIYEFIQIPISWNGEGFELK